MEELGALSMMIAEAIADVWLSNSLPGQFANIGYSRWAVVAYAAEISGNAFEQFQTRMKNEADPTSPSASSDDRSNHSYSYETVASNGAVDYLDRDSDPDGSSTASPGDASPLQEQEENLEER